MKMSAENLFVLEQLIRITQKEARHLIRTADRLKQQNPDLAWVCSLEHSDEHGEMLDAFVTRFGRLQDTLGDKLLSALLRASLEKTGTQLDNLLRGEKLGWIKSVQTWIELRELRNRLIHEYMESPEDLLEALLDALHGVQVLSDVQSRIAAYVQGIEAS
jgi:hypothetical protein